MTVSYFDWALMSYSQTILLAHICMPSVHPDLWALKLSQFLLKAPDMPTRPDLPHALHPRMWGWRSSFRLLQDLPRPESQGGWQSPPEEVTCTRARQPQKLWLSGSPMPQPSNLPCPETTLMFILTSKPGTGSLEKQGWCQGSHIPQNGKYRFDGKPHNIKEVVKWNL